MKFLVSKLSFSYLSLLIIIFFVYTFAGKLGLSFAYVNASASAIWPPTGIAIAIFLLYGLRMWPAIFIGAFIVNLTTQGTIVTSLGIALGNTLEGVIAYILIMRFANGVGVFEKVGSVMRFSLTACLATAVAATIGVATLFFGGYTHPGTITSVWLTWWLGDLGGALGVTPLIFLWLYNVHFGINIRRVGEFVLFLLLVAGVSEFVFFGALPYPYLCIPVLVFGAFRFNQREEATALFVLAAISIWSTIHGLGPYNPGARDLTHSLLLIQFFLITSAVTVLTITAALLERRQTKSALASSEERFRALIEKSFDAIILIDATSKILYASPSIFRILGYTPEELQGTRGFDLVIPEDQKMTMETLSKIVLKPGATQTIEYRSTKKDGNIIWVEVTGTNLLFDRNVGSVVVNFRDITERKMSEDILSQEKAEDEAMLASIGEGIMATDDTGRISLVNDAACEMLGRSRKDLIGASVVDTIPMQDKMGKVVPVVDRPMTKVLKNGKTIVTSPDNFYVRADKSTFPVQFTLSPILLKKKVVGTVEVFRDITQEAAVDKAKTEFVSLASHQLRTPLATINWYLERLLDKELGTLKPSQEKYLDEVYHASQRMVDLINTLLNVSRLDLGTFAIEPENVSLPKIIEDVLHEYKREITSKKLIVQKKIPKTFPRTSADPKLIRIILQNLLSNAIRYGSENGKVSIVLTHDEKNYTIEVKDTGIGIPKKDHNKIFTKMFRSDNAKIHDAGGNGLGLYLVKTIVEKTGGKIWFASEMGHGSTFYVSLPLSGMKKKIGVKQLR